MTKAVIYMTTQRRSEIRQFIQSKGEVQLSELTSLFPSVSSMTLRRDLDYLERQGQIIRIRGGAKSLTQLSMLKEAAYTQRQTENATAKMAIAEKALTLITPGRSIYLDSGTTCMCLAQRIPDQNLFILTAGPNIALELVKNASIKINLTGGQLSHDTLSLSGFNAAEYVRSLNIDLAVMATSAFSIENGFSCGDYFEAELKRLIIRKARQTAMLMDNSKVGTSMPYTFARLSQIQILVTDLPLPEEIQKAARQARVLLL
jgi:DeoR family transcriptional regulator, fructose operon transcriptional repressor